jgi:hypothetical protein
VFEVVLLNVSRTGFMASSNYVVHEHDRIAIDIPTLGPLPAWVVWTMNDRIGGSFVSPIDAETFAMLNRLFDLN